MSGMDRALTPAPPRCSLFPFGHLSGAAATGVLGFVPRFCLYIAAWNSSATDRISIGFATGIGALANSVSRASSCTGDPSSVAHSTTIALDVTAFGPGGIELTWTAAVTSHTGYLLVIG